jgi:hypothetical protein
MDGFFDLTKLRCMQYVLIVDWQIYVAKIPKVEMIVELPRFAQRFPRSFFLQSYIDYVCHAYFQGSI